MAIFSRRTLQRLVDENSEFLSRKQIKDHVRRLNNRDINVEWEIVLLNVFSKLGRVEHESVFNGKQPDLYFVSGDTKFSFLADIKTVSDEGIETKNPFDQLNERLHKEVLKHGIQGAWRIDIGGNYEEARRERKLVQMKLPALSRFDKEIFNQTFDEFASLIKANPSQPRKFEVRNHSVDLRISYHPSDRWTGTGSLPGYKSIECPEHLIQNSIWSGLVDKAEQLKGANFDGILGIVICDGGSDFLSKANRIVDEFLRNYQYIHFVLLFRVEQNFGSQRGNRVFINHFSNVVLDPGLEDFLSNFHNYVADCFPYAQRSARNALGVLKIGKAGKVR
jgi:hypothetical protein